MARSLDVGDVLAGMVGKRCEGLDNPRGSILRLEIGPLSQRPDEALSTRPHGWRHLTVLSPWRLESRDQVIADWNVPGGANGELLRAVECLWGQEITAIRAGPPGWDLTIEWSNGLLLLVFSDSNEDREDAWVILGTDGLELGVGPAKEGRLGYELKLPG